MSPILKSAQAPFQGTVRFLNRPVFKDGIKNTFGAVTFCFGIVEVYDIYTLIKTRQPLQLQDLTWKRTAHKLIEWMARFSRILSAATSRIGVYLISACVGCLFNSGQLEKAFGPNTIFAVNPWHPRHIASIAALALAMPELTLTTYRFLAKITSPATPDLGQRIKVIQLRALWFNTITSRPFLHIGNLKFC